MCLLCVLLYAYYVCSLYAYYGVVCKCDTEGRIKDEPQGCRVWVTPLLSLSLSGSPLPRDHGGSACSPVVCIRGEHPVHFISGICIRGNISSMRHGHMAYVQSFLDMLVVVVVVVWRHLWKIKSDRIGIF